MSAFIHQTDDATQIVWIDYTGKFEDLEFNLFAYDIDFYSSLYKNRIGIHYKNLTHNELAAFLAAAVVVVDALAKNDPLSGDERDRFMSALSVVLQGQKRAVLQGGGR